MPREKFQENAREFLAIGLAMQHEAAAEDTRMFIVSSCLTNLFIEESVGAQRLQIGRHHAQTTRVCDFEIFKIVG